MAMAKMGAAATFADIERKKNAPSLAEQMGEKEYEIYKATILTRQAFEVYYRNPDEFDNPMVKSYLRVATFCESLVNEESGEKAALYFNGFIIFCILLAGIMVGLQTYPPFDTKDPAWVICVNSLILIAFVVEIMVKLGANGMAPWRYFTGPEYSWNLFDFTIVVLSMPFVENTIFYTPGGEGNAGTIKILRLLRLARLAKLVNKVPKLKMIIMGLVGGLKSIFYIMLLLLLVFYIFGIAGMFFFGENDPFHFGTVPRAILSLFRAATLEDWTDIMYISMFGCARYPSGQYVVGKKKDLIASGVNKMYRCGEKARAQPTIAGIYWILFILVCSFVMLSLFIGVITLAMQESIEELQQQKVEAENLKRENKKRKREEEAGADPEHVEEVASTFTFAQRMQLKQYITEAIEKVQNTKFHAEDELANEGCIVRSYLELARQSAIIAESTWFTNIIIMAIITAGIAIGIENTLKTHPQGDKKEENFNALGKNLALLDLLINSLFSVECGIKIIAEGLHPFDYFGSNWNKFDFVVTLFSWPLFDIIGMEVDTSSLKILRIFRLFRVLKLLSRIPKLAMIVNALISGCESIGFISLIMVLVFYLFAILGVFLFGENDPWHYGRLHRAMLTLFRLSTFEDWTDVMYVNILGCNNWQYGGDDTMPYGGMCENPQKSPILASFFHFMFAVISAMVLLTLFVGVVSTSMEEAGKKAELKRDLEMKVDEYGVMHGLPRGVVTKYRKIFAMLDSDEGGTLDTDEIKTGFIDVGVLDSNYDLGAMLKELEKREEGDVGKIRNAYDLDILDFTGFMHEYSLKSDDLAPGGEKAESRHEQYLQGGN